MSMTLDQAAVTFRYMANADLPAVRALHGRSFAALARDWHTQEQIAGHIALIDSVAYETELQRCHVELALRDDEIVATSGWIAVRERPGTARIRKVFVHPDIARCGLGSHMVCRAEAAARRSGYGRMIVRANINAVPLYTKLGYIKIDDVMMDVGGGVMLPAVMMEKPNAEPTAAVTFFP